jgi:N-acetylglutamate synthase-like GNAT family acetyltransferase
MPLTVEPYTAPYKEQVVAHILAIQRGEFAIPITRADQPDLDAVETFYQTGAGNFWLALDAGRVVGTVALVDIGGGLGALRKMFVHAGYRGGAVAAKLLATLLAWAGEKGMSAIYLGTTAKFLAAHRFYEKNGFVEVQKDDLPAAFPVMKVDSRFYRYDLSSFRRKMPDEMPEENVRECQGKC